MPEALAVPSKTNQDLALQWLALSLTEGLGPKRGRNLVEHLGGVQSVFKASLTELEAAGIWGGFRPISRNRAAPPSCSKAHAKVVRRLREGWQERKPKVWLCSEACRKIRSRQNCRVRTGKGFGTKDRGELDRSYRSYVQMCAAASVAPMSCERWELLQK